MTDKPDKHRKTTQRSPDNVYVDVKVSNDGSERFVLAKYSQQKSEAILDDPSQYYLALVRWRVPGSFFPLLIMPIQDNQPNHYLSQYSVTFETSTDVHQQYLYYYSQSPSPDPVPTDAIPEQKVNSFYFVYDYQHVVSMVNHALNSAFLNVTGKPALAAIPFMVYHEDTGRFGIVANLVDYGVDIQPTPIGNPTTDPTYSASIKIFFNEQLFNLFSGIPSKFFNNSTLGRDAQILIQNYGENSFPIQNTMVPWPSGLVITEQNYNSTSNWSPVKQILFQTSTIPIQAEYTSVSHNSYKKILTDFEPNYASPLLDPRQTLQYYPQGPYRLIDLIGTNPLYNIDLFVTWIDTDGHEFYAAVPPHDQFTAKLLFVRRDVYKQAELTE